MKPRLHLGGRVFWNINGLLLHLLILPDRRYLLGHLAVTLELLYFRMGKPVRCKATKGIRLKPEISRSISKSHESIANNPTLCRIDNRWLELNRRLRPRCMCI